MTRRARAPVAFFAALLLLASCGESDKAIERRRQAIRAFGACMDSSSFASILFDDA